MTNFEPGKKYKIDHSKCPNPLACLADPAGVMHDTAIVTEVEPTVVMATIPNHELDQTDFGHDTTHPHPEGA